MSNSHDYTYYYGRAIQQHTTGLKLGLGSTGFGKTSSIPKVIAAGITERKFIYGANRVHLLNEMAAHLEKANIKFVHLQRDVDIVVNLLGTPQLRVAFDELLASPLVTKPLARMQQRGATVRLDVATVRRACTQIERCLAILHMDGVSDLLEQHAHVIQHFFQRILREVGQGGTTSNRPREHQRLTAHPVIRHLFPYIEFREAKDKPILLVTIQKLFHGFFDGLKMVNLSQLKGPDGNYVIFLDEFDFLESNLIELICSDAEIEAPFRFVEAFYRAMKWHKLPLASYPTTDNTIRTRIEQIVNEIDQLRTTIGLDFPNINQFTCSDPTLKGQAIFQTSRTVTTRSLYLRQTERSFEVVPRDTADGHSRGLPAFRLFRFVTTTMQRILYLFKDLESQHPTVYREMIRHCFENTDFDEAVSRIRQFPQRHHAQVTQFDQLLDGGYSLYEIHDLQQTSDQEEAAFRHFAIYTTPEKLLLALATHNLVFGLSATADIPRCVRSFSDEWLRHQEGLNYIDVDDTDRAIIQHLNRQKQSLRANQVHVVQAEELDMSNTFQYRLSQFIDGIADDLEFGQNDSGGHRKRRVARFFAALLRMGQYMNGASGTSNAHLLFFNSFRQIHHVFTHHPQPDDQLFTIHPLPAFEGRLFEAYEISIDHSEYIVLFYNAEQGQRINSSVEAKRQYHELFWQGKPVVLVTTYPSAGNGVNLQYYPTSDAAKEVDFTHLHLLESPYYYFGKVSEEQTSEEQTSIIKQNFWYLAKLFESKLLSEAMFRRYLANIRHRGLSSEYRANSSTARDALLNQITTYIQALGRGERAWEPIADQVMHFSREVYEDLVVFCTRSEYADLFERRINLNSYNLQQVFEKIRAEVRDQNPIIERSKDERLGAINDLCRVAIEELVARLAKVRAGNSDLAAKDEWQSLREVVLKLDLHHPILRRYHCLFQTTYVRDGTLFIDEELTLYRPDAAPPGCRQWRLDQVYQRLRDNEVIRQLFTQRGYELGITTLAGIFLTPYCYQAILTGALGETAILALLQHEGITLETPPDALFEVADYKIVGLPYYIDVKYYSERTLDAFQLTPDDPDWRPKLNEADFRQHAQRKIEQIRRYHNTENSQCKLIYLNVASTNDRVRRYANEDFTLVDTITEAQIIVIQGVLNSQQPNMYTDAFRAFLNDLQRLQQQ